MFGLDKILSPLAELPVVGGMFGPNAATRGKERDVRDAMRRMSANLERYRPEVQGAHMAGLNARLDAFGPVNQALVAMYGPGAAIPLEGLRQNPFGEPPPQQQIPLAPQAPMVDPRAHLEPLRQHELVRPYNVPAPGNPQKPRGQFG
jgi:hypothetical protein